MELDQHDIVLAEDCRPSYLDTGNRGLFDNATVPLISHPDFAVNDGQARREALSRAPFTVDTSWIERIWRQLAMRARRLRFPPPEAATPDDSDFHVVANGRTLAAIEMINGRYVFVLPPNTDVVRLVSRSGGARR